MCSMCAVLLLCNKAPPSSNPLKVNSHGLILCWYETRLWTWSNLILAAPYMVCGLNEGSLPIHLELDWLPSWFIHLQSLNQSKMYQLGFSLAASVYKTCCHTEYTRFVHFPQMSCFRVKLLSYWIWLEVDYWPSPECDCNERENSLFLPF